MRKILKITLIINIFIFSLNAEDKRIDLDNKMKKLDEKLTCLAKKKLEDKLDCLKERVEKEIAESYNDGVQLSVFSEKNKKEAEREKNNYNKWKEKVDSLRNSKAEYLLKEFKGHKKIKDGKYYVVFVVQEGESVKKLQEKIKKNYPKSYSNVTIFKSPKVVIEY